MSAYQQILAQPRDLLRWPYTPDAAAQFRKLTLEVTPGMDGWRLAFIGGTTFEPIVEIVDGREAWNAYRAACAAAARLFSLGEDA